jgi:hypothetical protein
MRKQRNGTTNTSIMSRTKLLFLAVCIGLTGCVSEGPTVKIPIAGGERLLVDLSRHGVVGEEDKDVKVIMAELRPNAKEKKALYSMVLEFKTSPRPRSVKIEDVSENPSSVMIDDANPKVNGKLWFWASAPKTADAPELQWIKEIDESFRVYRISVALDNGRQVSFYHVVFYTPMLKWMIRKGLGLEEPK